LAIISIGTNDIVNQPVNAYYSPQQITQNLKNIRAGLGAEKNLWVLPYDPQARALVLNVAQQFGDQTLDLADFKKADRYHPLKYGDIANALRPSIAQALDAAMQKAAKQTPPLSAPWASTSAVLSNRPSSF
jgi:lysophospholipase L1-like esterase